MGDKIWFITGASRGFGRLWTEAALARGDKVAATARNVSSLDELKERFGDAVLPLALDVTSTEQAKAAVKQAHDHFGRLDVIVNNAGYTLVGTVEEASEEDVRALFDTNLLGSLRVIQAVLPLLRAQGSGHIIGVSSGMGVMAAPLIGFYCASKWAFEAMHESLSKEVADFGVKVTMIEPGAYATEFGTPASRKMADGMDVYAEFRTRTFASLAGAKHEDPKNTPAAVLKIVDSAEPPLRFFLGGDGLPMARRVYADRLATWEAWSAASEAA